MMDVSMSDVLDFLGKIAWPIIVLIIFISIRKHINDVLNKEELSIEIAGFQIGLKDATEQAKNHVTALLDRVATIERHLNIDEMADRTQIKSDLSVLWVDDYPSNNAFLVEKFRQDGVEVELSLNTVAAINQLKSRDFDVIISDLGRIESGVNNPFAGLDLLEKISSLDVEIPTAIYAGRRGLENERRLKAAGAKLVTSSPTDIIVFVEHYRHAKT